jgi:hypothetical protein
LVLLGQTTKLRASDLEYTFGNSCLDWTLALEAIGDRHVAALLSMNP